MLFFAGLSLHCFAAGIPVRLTGTFSSFEFHRQSGDLNGIEIRLIRVRGGIKGVVQFAEGGAGDVMLTDVSTTENNITFSSPANYQPAFTFEGAVRQKEIIGKVIYSGGAVEKVVLKRQPSYWDR